MRSNFSHWSLLRTSESDKQVAPEFMLYSWLGDLKFTVILHSSAREYSGTTVSNIKYKNCRARKSSVHDVTEFYSINRLCARNFRCVPNNERGSELLVTTYRLDILYIYYFRFIYYIF